MVVLLFSMDYLSRLRITTAALHAFEVQAHKEVGRPPIETVLSPNVKTANEGQISSHDDWISLCLRRTEHYFHRKTSISNTQTLKISSSGRTTNTTDHFLLSHCPSIWRANPNNFEYRPTQRSRKASARSLNKTHSRAVPGTSTQASPIKHWGKHFCHLCLICRGKFWQRADTQKDRGGGVET